MNIEKQMLGRQHQGRIFRAKPNVMLVMDDLSVERSVAARIAAKIAFSAETPPAAKSEQLILFSTHKSGIGYPLPPEDKGGLDI